MEKDNVVNFIEWGKERSEKIKHEYLKEILVNKGLEVNDDNIALVEYDMDFSDDLKQVINENNLLSLIKDGNEVVSYGMRNNRIQLHFSDGNSIEFFVDINGKIQTNLHKLR